MSKKELELLKRVTWMGYLWAQSLRDAGALIAAEIDRLQSKTKE